MNNPDLTAFLRNLWHQGIELWLEAEQLRFRGNKKVMDGPTMATLKEHKSAIIDILKEHEGAYAGHPLSHGQRAIHLMQTMAPESYAYNQVCLLRLNSLIQRPALDISLTELLQRHAPLRSVIKDIDGIMAQQQQYQLNDIFNIKQAQFTPDQLNDWCETISNKPFQIESEPLLRITLLENTGEVSGPDNYLHICAHHIIADFWAMELMVKELQCIYSDTIKQQPSSLPKLGKLFKDYVIDEAQWLNSDAGQQAKQYWHEKLTPLPPTLELPTDYVRPTRQSFEGKEYPFELGLELTRQLKQQAKQQHVTPFVWVLSAYQSLLHRYTGENNIAIGSPIAARTHSDFQRLTGHFTNPVTLLNNFAETHQFSPLLQHNKNQVVNALKHQLYPLQCLIEELQPQRDANNSPIFQVAISWNQLNEAPIENSDADALINDITIMQQRGAMYDLVLTAYDKGDNIELSWRYNSDLFKASSIQRLAKHLLNILSLSCENPRQSIHNIDFRTPSEMDLATAINQTDKDYPQQKNLAAIFQQIAQQQPDLVAYKQAHGEKIETVTYAELDRYSNQLANYLSQQGVCAGQTVSLCLNRSLDMLAGILASLKLGCIYNPIDPIYPKERIGQILSQSAPAMIISHSSTQRKIAFVSDRPLLQIDQQQKAIEAASPTFALFKQGHVKDDTVACILFTSGSTGTPKGVQIPHRAIKRLAINNGFFEVNAGETFCYVSNVSFDATNIEIWGSLLNGGTLLYVPTETILDPKEFSSFIRRHKPNASVITTALFNVLINFQANIFKDFKSILVGGEALDINLIRKCCVNGKPQNLVNIYGPTENGTVSTVFEMADLQDSDNSVPIGKPNNNSQVYIHDRKGNACATGIIGEIIVGGDGVAVGYLNQNQLTHEKFSDDFYRGKGLLYATGDMGFIRPDGQIIYTGRKDDQVKIRGYRIELGEVEQHLSLHPKIKMGCVIAIKDSTGSSHLAAYYTTHNGLTNGEVKQYLRKNLPDFMVPSAFMKLSDFPINANGKIDKQQLPSISFERHEQYIAPRNKTETTIAHIWQQLLNVSEVGIYDNFFDLGGHSLMAVKAATELTQRLTVDINMRMIFEAPTIAEFSERLNQKQTQNTLPVLSPYTGQEPVAASMAQQRLWFLQQLDQDSNAYNMPVAIRLKQSLKSSAMEATLKQLIQRHESLRTCFRDEEGIAYLDINSADDWSLPLLDLTQLDSNDAEAKAKEQINRLANAPFKLNEGPLLKALLIHINKHEHILILCLHHIIIDGWSVELLLSELGQIWDTQQHKQTATVVLPALACQYSDFSVWQRQWLKGSVLEEQLDYWKQKLEGAPALLNLPTDKTRPAVLSNAGADHHFTINATLANQLRQLSQDNSATLFMTMMAAYSLLLSRYSQQSDICIGFPISGRSQANLEPILGLFVNNLVIRSDLSDNPSVNDFIQQVRQTTIEAYAHQDAPFDLIVDALNLERSLSYTPLLQASFSLEGQTFANKISSVLGEYASLEKLDWHISKYDINLSCFETSSDGDILACIEYNTDLYQDETIQRVADHYLRLLEVMVKKSNIAVNELRLMTEQERHALIESWQSQASHNKLTLNAINRFEIQSAKYAKNTAVSFENSAIDYQTLNMRANQLAHFLQANNIGAGDFVGLYTQRSIDLVISILAILKTGAAYIPLDPSAPKDRLNYIIEDASIQHIISCSNLADDIQVKHLFCLDQLSASLNNLATDNLNIYIPNDACAYVIYTSGTTGKPKGCLVSHANLARLFVTTDPQYGFNQHDVWSLFHSYAFDFSVWEIWGALLYGGRISIVPQWMTRAPDAFYQHLIDEKVTVLNQTPSAFSQLINIDAQTTADNLHLRYVIFGGEALDFNALPRWVDKHPLQDVKLINMYGITETTVHASYHPITDEDIQRGRSIIGKPLNDLLIHILDSHGQLVPTGVLGEMYISGAGVSLGYLNRPDLTADRFVENPFLRDLPKDVCNAHKRMYRSGDLARRLNNGDIEYLGRIDHQVKIRGYRIELGEIETALSNLDNIQESIVIAREDEPGMKRLIAYLLVNDLNNVDLDNLRLQLRTHLPEYMLPSAFVPLSEWPLTANGKIDNIRLPTPDTSNFSNKDYIAPRNDSEQVICLTWAEILGIEKVGVHDNFFELGGHSLLATQVASRIRTELECSLELKSIFENPTPAELAMVILEEEISALDMDDDDLLALLDELEGEG